LDKIDGVSAGISGASISEDGLLVISASAEETDNWYDDGEIAGSSIGIIQISDLEKNNSKKIKYFIQVNIGNEIQKNGINISLVSDFVQYCQKDLKLNILGLMCIPPVNVSPESYFLKLKKLNDDSYLKDLSMGMSDDFEIAIKLGSTFVRVGTAIFGKRSN